MGDVSLNMLDIADLGKAVHYIFNHQDECINKTFPLVAEKRMVKEMADMLSKELRPYAVEYSKVRREFSTGFFVVVVVVFFVF